MNMQVFGFLRGGQARRFFVIVLAAACCFITGTWRGQNIKGNVRYGGAPFDKEKTVGTTSQYICGKANDSDDLLPSPNNGIRNAVVLLQNIPTGAKREWNLPAAKMEQKQCSFTPRVVIVPVGGTV